LESLLFDGVDEQMDFDEIPLIDGISRFRRRNDKST
jgi:hypothetical protein